MRGFKSATNIHIQDDEARGGEGVDREADAPLRVGELDLEAINSQTSPVQVLLLGYHIWTQESNPAPEVAIAVLDSLSKSMQISRGPAGELFFAIPRIRHTRFPRAAITVPILRSVVRYVASTEPLA
jgi:hypothetical protein